MTGKLVDAKALLEEQGRKVLCYPTPSNEAGAEQNPAQAEEHVRNGAVDPVAVDLIQHVRPYRRQPEE